MRIFKDILNALRQEEADSHIHTTPLLTVSGVGTGSAYTSGDAFGRKITLHVPVEGTISNVVFQDLDDEGINKELVLFDRDFEETADNAAFAVSDADLAKCIGVAYINTWSDFGNNQVGQAVPALSYVTPNGMLYAQLVTRGADNIAAGAIPTFFVVVV